MRLIRWMFFTSIFILGMAPGFSKSGVPMAVNPNVDIADGEKLHYSVLKGKDKIMEMIMVSKYQADGIIKCFFHVINLANSEKFPDNFEKYSSYMLVDKKKAALLRYVLDLSDMYVGKNKEKGMYLRDITFGKDVIMEMKNWDGYETTVQRSRIRDVDIRFPSWFHETFIVYGARLFDWTKPGIINLFTPVTKEPVKTALYKIGEVTIDTPLGRIDTEKTAYTVSDSFLGKLLKQYTDAFIFYIEKGPKRRLVKFENGLDGTTWVLDKAEITR